MLEINMHGKHFKHRHDTEKVQNYYAGIQRQDILFCEQDIAQFQFFSV
jgi:hypothetical protein